MGVIITSVRPIDRGSDRPIIGKGPIDRSMGVRDQFRLGGLRSVARILHDFFVVARIWLFEKF